jgi:integrase
MVKLTTKSVENLKPAAVRREIPDTGCKGLYAIVQPTGRRAWAVRYRYAGKTRKLTLDGGLSLAAARQAATAALRELEQGRDPAALKFDAEAAAKKAAAERAGDTVDNLAARFIEQHAKKRTRQNSWRQAVHVFDDIVLPVWSGRVIHDIQRRDVRELVERVAEDRPVMANRALAHLSKFFAWLCQRDVIQSSPCVGVVRPAEEKARERLLDDNEIRRLWLACDAIDGPAGRCIQLLLLTGQRRGEIAGAKWSEVHGDVLEFSAERMKGKQPHVVPLSGQATAIIASLPRIGDYIFGRSPINHFDRIKREIDAHMGDTPPWVVHDLRRTVASGLAKLKVPVPVIEKVLAHRSGTFRGIVQTYQRHDYLDEKRDALRRWADHIAQLVGKIEVPPANTVVPMPARRTV